VGGADAAGALGRADDDVAWRVKEPLPALTGPDRVVQGGDRVRVAARPQARHRREVVAVPGRYHQVVVVVAAAGRRYLPGRQVQRGGLGVHEVDPVGLERGRQREGDVRGTPLAERQPDQRRIEQEPVGGRDHPHVHVAVQLMLDGQGRGQAAEVSPEH
jgi:hypothetical protein